MLNRAEIIRALIDGLIDSGMDITGRRVRGRLAGARRPTPGQPLPLTAADLVPVSEFVPHLLLIVPAVD